jgi:hypothetical protein
MANVKGEALETLKAAPSVGFFATWMAGVDWNATAAFLACIYTTWLIGEKAWKAWKGRGKHRH